VVGLVRVTSNMLGMCHVYSLLCTGTCWPRTGACAQCADAHARAVRLLLRLAAAADPGRYPGTAACLRAGVPVIGRRSACGPARCKRSRQQRGCCRRSAAHSAGAGPRGAGIGRRAKPAVSAAGTGGAPLCLSSCARQRPACLRNSYMHRSASTRNLLVHAFMQVPPASCAVSILTQSGCMSLLSCARALCMALGSHRCRACQRLCKSLSYDPDTSSEA